MTVSIAQWESPFPFDDIHELGPDNEDGWRTLELMYSREGSEEYPPIGFDRPLYRCLEVARELGAYVAVTETRYMDIDYRSEYSAFYSRAFEHFEESTRRIHFFSVPLDDDAIIDLVRTPQSEIETPSERSKSLGYLGYMIVRPQVHGVVGRTMLKPPERLRHSVRTAVKETVNFFGQELEVRAVPSSSKMRVWAPVRMLHRGCVITVPISANVECPVVPSPTSAPLWTLALESVGLFRQQV